MTQAKGGLIKTEKDSSKSVYICQSYSRNTVLESPAYLEPCQIHVSY